MTTPKQPAPNPVNPMNRKPVEILDPVMRSVIDGAADVSLEDIEKLKDAMITDTDARKIVERDVLEIKDDPSHPQVGHLKFAWLSPTHRAKVGMLAWQWVKGELAQVVRQAGIVEEAIGGGSATSVVTSGDLMLAFMLRDTHSKLKSARRDTSTKDLDDILSKRNLRDDLDPEFQEVERTVNVKKTYEGRRV